MVAFGSPVVPEVKPSSATSSRPVCTAVKRTGLFSATRSSSASWLEVPSKLTTCLQEAAGLGAGDQFVGDAAVGQRQRDLGLVDDFCQLARAQHRHGVDDDRAGFGRRQPRRHQRRIVAGADQHAMARLDAVILDQRMRQAVGPVGELLVGALPPVADQRGVIAKALFDHAVGQLDAGVEIFGYWNSGRSSRSSGHCPDGGRLRRAKSSTCPEGPRLGISPDISPSRQKRMPGNAIREIILYLK